jgi:hypothetical protein
MPLTLITGPANAGKAGAVLDGFLAARESEPLLVVPRYGDVARYQAELGGRGAVFAGRVLRFAWLWREIARRTGAGVVIAGPLLRRALIEAAVERAAVRTMADSAASAGFPAALERLFQELGREGIEPADMDAALAGGRPMARELAGLYAAYRAVLEEAGRTDEPGAAATALAALRADPARWGATPVFLYGFDDFTGQEIEAVEVLSRDAGAPVTVSLTFEEGHPAFAGRERTAARLGEVADSHRPMPARAQYYAPAAREPLHRLERGLFAPAPPNGDRPEPGDAVQLLEAGGERSEMELMAAEVLNLLRRGIPAREIAIVLRAPEAAADRLAGVLADYGVPAAVPRRMPLSSTALGRALVAALRCALGAGTADDLVTYLRAPGLLDEPQAVDRLEGELRRRRASSAGTARESWERDHATLDELDAVAAAGREGAAALATAVQTLARRLFSAPHRGRAAILGGEESEDAAAYRALREALEEIPTLAGVPGAHQPQPDDVLDALEQVDVDIAAADASGVVVADPLAVRARRFRAVVVLGLQEGEFPRPARPEPFLAEDELAALGLRRARLEQRLEDERFLFYAVASRPSERLVLSYRTCDEEGRPATPSFFLDEVRALLSPELEAQRRVRRLHEPAWPPDRAPTARERARALAAVGPREPETPLGPPTSVAAQELLATLDVSSAGSLEAFASCPVRWLVDHWLRPGRLAPEYPWFARGSYAHDLLADTFVRLQERTGSARLDGESLPAALECLDEAAGGLTGGAGLGPTRAAANGAARRVQSDVRRLLEREAAAAGTLVPDRFELSFGFEGEDEGSLPPLELGGLEPPLRLRGRIDRVDVDADTGAALVRDYKVGGAKPEYQGARWEEQRQLQVALYLLAVEAHLGLRAVGGVYQPLRARGSDQRARGLLREGAPELRSLLDHGVLCEADADDEFDATLEQARARAIALARRLRAGDVRPCPETCTPNSGGCAHPGVCRSLP